MIEETIHSYFENKRGVVAVYLFGSYAEGAQRHSSDLDIGILLDDQVQEASETRDAFMVGPARILRKDIHPVILNSAGETLLKQIFSKGQCVVVNDQKKLIHYRMVPHYTHYPR